MAVTGFRFLLFSMVCAGLRAQAPDVTFFETKIRPVLATKCYACHSSALKAPMSGLVLDRKDGVAKVSDRLVKALSYTDPLLQMPPSGKLPDAVIADFEKWIAGGMPMPAPPATAPTPAASAYKGMSLEDGRKWWAFQPLKRVPPPKVKNAAWAVNPIDSFILAKLEAKGLKPSPAEEKRTLVRRAYVDLVGYKPTYEEVEAFANDPSPDAWEELIDRLQASPQYGERWGRHWMDVARFGEDNPTSEATNPAYPFAWRYRDWIIDAVNRDVPYDRFVKLQLAADLMPGTPRDDLRALGYLGAAPIYHKDQRLSADVIGGFMTDDWDERVDAVSRGLLGLTVSCARCHDHKFDPITTKDYYGLVGVFASTMRAERPMLDVDPKVEQRYLWAQNRLFDLRYAANLLTGEASTVVGSEARVAKWKAEIETLKTEMTATLEQYPLLLKSLEKFWTPPQRRPPPPHPLRAAPAAGATPAAGVAVAAVAAPQPNRRGRVNTSNEPFMNAVYDAAQFVDGSDAQFTWMVYKAGRSPRFPGAAARQRRDAGRDRSAAFSGRTCQGRRPAEERIGPAGTGGEDLHRCGAAGCEGDRQSRLGMALRQAAGGHAQRLRSAGREADSSGTAGRSGGALHRAWLELEVAQSRDHDVGGVPAIQPAARGRGEDRSDQLAVVADESAAAGCGIVSRHAAAFGRPPERQDVRAVRRCRSGDQRAPHGVLRVSAAGA